MSKREQERREALLIGALLAGSAVTFMAIVAIIAACIASC